MSVYAHVHTQQHIQSTGRMPKQKHKSNRRDSARASTCLQNWRQPQKECCVPCLNDGRRPLTRALHKVHKPRCQHFGTPGSILLDDHHQRQPSLCVVPENDLHSITTTLNMKAKRNSQEQRQIRTQVHTYVRRCTHVHAYTHKGSHRNTHMRPTWHMESQH